MNHYDAHSRLNTVINVCSNCKNIIETPLSLDYTWTQRDFTWGTWHIVVKYINQHSVALEKTLRWFYPQRPKTLDATCSIVRIVYIGFSCRKLAQNLHTTGIDRVFLPCYNDSVEKCINQLSTAIAKMLWRFFVSKIKKARCVFYFRDACIAAQSIYQQQFKNVLISI